MKRLTVICLALGFAALIAVTWLLSTRSQTSAGAARVDLARRSEVTPTVNGELQQWLPLVMQDRAPAWWHDYPPCPGEEIDAAGFGEPGGNDLWDVYGSEAMPVPYTCTGWIHWARGYWDPGENPDSDHFYFTPRAGHVVRITLARLPVDYRLIGYVPREDPGGGVRIAGETLVSAHLGTEDEQFVIEASVAVTHTLIVHSQLDEFGQVEYDPVQPYLLSVVEE